MCSSDLAGGLKTIDLGRGELVAGAFVPVRTSVWCRGIGFGRMEGKALLFDGLLPVGARRKDMALHNI